MEVATKLNGDLSRSVIISGTLTGHNLSGNRVETDPNKHQSLQEEDEDLVNELLEDFKPLEEGFSSASTSHWVTSYTKLILPSLYIGISNYGYDILNLYGIYLANQTENVVIQSSFGLMIFANIVITFGIFYSIEQKVSIETSLAMGAGNFPQAKKTFWQGFSTFVFATIFIFCPIVYQSNYIFRKIGIQEENIDLTCLYLKRLFPIEVLRMANEMVLNFSLSQGVKFNFGLFSILNCFASLGIGMLANHYFDMGINAWLVSKAANDIINSFIFFYPYFFQIEPRTRGFLSLSEIFQGYMSFLLDCGRFMLSIYSEWISSQLVFYFTMLFNDMAQIAAYSSYRNLVFLIVGTGCGFTTVGKTRLNMLLGRGYRTAAKNFFYLFLLGTIAVCFVISLALWICRFQITQIYAGNEPQVRSWFLKIISLYPLLLPLGFLFGFIISVCRSTGYLNLNICLNMVILILYCLGADYVIVFIFKWSFVELVVNYYLALVMIYLTIMVVLIKADWKTLKLMLDE